jgi:hypothetical protein
MGKQRPKKSIGLAASKPKSVKKGKPAKRSSSRAASATQVEAANAAPRRLGRPVTPLTSQEIATGKSHTPQEIDLAGDSMITIVLRRDRTAAFIVACHCALCDQRRAAHFRA